MNLYKLYLEKTAFFGPSADDKARTAIGNTHDELERRYFKDAYETPRIKALIAKHGAADHPLVDEAVLNGHRSHMTKHLHLIVHQHEKGKSLKELQDKLHKNMVELHKNTSVVGK